MVLYLVSQLSCIHERMVANDAVVGSVLTTGVSESVSSVISVSASLSYHLSSVSSTSPSVVILDGTVAVILVKLCRWLVSSSLFNETTAPGVRNLPLMVIVLEFSCRATLVMRI